jgi:uncharacterized protein
MRALQNTFAAAVAAVLLLSPGMAQQSAQDRVPFPHIRVHGDAIITAAPDQAEVDIGVMTQAKTAQEAAAQNARQLEAVMQALRRTLGADAQFRTIGYTVHPIYHHPRDGRPLITGYTASNVVRVTTSVPQAGAAIDAAMQAGANQIHRLQFSLKDEAGIRAQALREAAVKARSKAEALAAGLNLRITRLLQVAETEPQVVHPVRELAMARADVATPIEPGTVEVRANVTLTVEVAQ